MTPRAMAEKEKIKELLLEAEIRSRFDIPRITEADRKKRITGRDLLECFFSLRCWAPEMERWTAEGLADSHPAFFRLLQLKALFAAFGIAWDPKGFLFGSFIWEEDSKKYDVPLKAMLAAAPARSRKHLDGQSLGEHQRQLSGCFRILFEYRDRLGSPLGITDGVLEMSGMYCYAYMKAEEMNVVIRKKRAEVDRLLAGLISPEGKSFSVARLIREFGYPDVDVMGLEWDWF